MNVSRTFHTAHDTTRPLTDEAFVEMVKWKKKRISKERGIGWYNSEWEKEENPEKAGPEKRIGKTLTPNRLTPNP